ncbi:MAG: sugar ABC transporter ATP-binding protein [Devosia sp.]
MTTIVAINENRSGVADGDLLLVAENIRKSFPGVLALDGVGLKLRRGTVHALMGENGAGKSTLMKILAGIYQPDEGTIFLKGKEVTLKTPLDALSKGIAMIHQELNLMPHMTVSENIWIRREPRNRLGIINHREMNRKTSDLLARLHILIAPDVDVGRLSIADRQMVEIAKAVSYETDILIMDEPTSALTEREAEHLFGIIRQLKGQGVGIVYISHKMSEIFEIADELSVFRDGKFVATTTAAATNRDEIIKMMVGREISDLFPKVETEIGDVRLSVRNLCLKGVFDDVSFDLRAGEILGVAGLVGAKRSDVAEVIFGVVPATSGEIRIDGKPVRIGSPTKAVEHGMAFLTEDRKETGCLMVLDVLENMQVAVLQGRKARFGFARTSELHRKCAEMVQKLRVKTPSMHAKIQNLSGGNQQKVLFARWLLTEPNILILDEPTKGIDVAAKAEIHAIVAGLAKAGAAVLLISSELPEILGMSDNVMVMHAGKVTGTLSRAEATQVNIMELAAK